MTQDQLREQKINEQKGYPSNLNEASRVQNLESQVSQINDSISKMAGMLSNVLQAKQSVSPVEPHPIPRANPVDVPLVLGGNPIGNPPMTPPPCPTVAPPTAAPTPPVNEPALSTPETPPEKEGGSIPMTLGPAGTTGVSPAPGPPVEDTPEIPAPADEDKLEVVEAVVDPIAEKAEANYQNLLRSVTLWLQTKDVLKFWRQFIAGSCSKNLSYNTWPESIRKPFDERFGQMLRDETFVGIMCKRILSFSTGHIVAPNIAAGFVVAMAGFLAFALQEN